MKNSPNIISYSAGLAAGLETAGDAGAV